jgi:hypothetical protein
MALIIQFHTSDNSTQICPILNIHEPQAHPNGPTAFEMLTKNYVCTVYKNCLKNVLSTLSRVHIVWTLF